MSEVIAFHPKKSKLDLLYEVVEGEGESRWGGANPYEAIRWLRLAPVGSRLLVSGWEGDDVDAQPVGQPLDITNLVTAIIASLL